ncbi:Uncharacterised protein [Mycobacteroides abscessus subsp. abscessus]|nr:Uncharacterised protein [Mycobacteroides abscessus subsp. abscessus]
MASNVISAEQPSGLGESRREAAADGHRIAVAPGVVVCTLDGVRERVSVVEDFAQAAFSQVGRHDAGLDCDRAGGDVRKLRAVRSQKLAWFRLLDDAQDLRVRDETALNDLGGTGRQIGCGQALEEIHIGDHGGCRIERTDEVLPNGRVDTRLTANACVNHSEERCRNVDEGDAPQPCGGDETSHVGSRSPTHGDDRVFTSELKASALVPQG